jgi:methanogenic corrinoid protein MtbC1
MKLQEYVDHLIAGEDEVCLAEAREIAKDLPGLHRLYVDTIQPSQYKVGEIWEGGKISVATEHLATATNSYVATRCYASLAREMVGGPRAMIACAQEELHELGPRLLSDLLDCDGWDVDFYGTSMPLRDLIGAIEERRPRFVGLSVALVMHLGSVRSTITSIREALGSKTPPIAVGGNAFRGGDDLWKRVGADLYAPDASAAVTMLRELRD